MSFDLTWPPILGAVGLVIAFAIYLVMSRYTAGDEKVRGIADEIHIGAMVFMHREYKMLFAFAAVCCRYCAFAARHQHRDCFCRGGCVLCHCGISWYVRRNKG